MHENIQYQYIFIVIATYVAWPDRFLAQGVIACSIRALILQAITPCAKKAIWPRETNVDLARCIDICSYKRSMLVVGTVHS